jgi:hypothetical protein
MPPIEIAEGTIAAEEIAVVLHHSRRKIEPDECKRFARLKDLDSEPREPLLHVKQGRGTRWC